MRQEPAQQFVAGQQHHFALVAVDLEAEFDRGAVEAQQAGVRDRGAMTVAPEIIDHRPGAGKAGLGFRTAVEAPRSGLVQRCKSAARGTSVG